MVSVINISIVSLFGKIQKKLSSSLFYTSVGVNPLSSLRNVLFIALYVFSEPIIDYKESEV